MKIQIGNFGNVTPEAQRQTLIPQDSQMANAINNVGRGITEIGEAETAKRRTGAAVNQATLENDAQDIHDQVKTGIEKGEIKPEDGVSAYRERFNAIKMMRLDDMDQNQLDLINNGLIRVTGRYENSINDVALKRTREDIGSNIYTVSEQLQRKAMRDLPGSVKQFDMTVDAMGPQAGWNPIQIEKAKQQFKESSTFNYANAVQEGAAQTGKRDLVEASIKWVEGPDGEILDPAKRTQLITKGYAYLNGIDAAEQRAAEKAQREQEAREAAAVDTVNKAFDLHNQGKYFSKEFIDEASATVSGTKQAGAFMQLVKAQKTSTGFASMSLPEQAAQLERMNAAGADRNVGVTPAEQAVVKQFTIIHKSSVEAYKENPWKAAQERGVIQDAPVIEMTNIQDAQSTLAQRMRSIRIVEAAAGKKISPLQPEEAESMGRMIRMLPPDQQSSALAAIGNSVGDADRVTALAKQMGDKDKVLGIAMMYANSRTAYGKYTSEYILKGERAIQDKSVAIDEKRETGWRGDISRQVGDAFPNQEVRRQMINASYYIQAALAADGNPDTGRAVLLATGGIVERNGSKIPLPYGWDSDDLNKALRSVKPGNIQSTKGYVYSGKTAIPVDQFIQQLPNAALEHAGQGKYSIKAGTGYITDGHGRRVVINVRSIQ